MIYTFNKEGCEFKFSDLTDNAECKNWLIKTFDHWEPFTFESFRKVADTSKIAIDIGAWIGLTGIYLCKNFKEVICIEADKFSVKSLKDNLETSGCTNYKIINKAIYNTQTSLYFGPNSFKHDSKLNESMSQLKSNSDKIDDYMIETITLNDVLKDISLLDIALIKVDIEGGEEFIIPDLMQISSSNKIPVLLSFHIHWWKDKFRFEHLFKSCTMLNERGIIVTDLGNYLLSNPFGTIFCTYN